MFNKLRKECATFWEFLTTVEYKEEFDKLDETIDKVKKEKTVVSISSVLFLSIVMLMITSIPSATAISNSVPSKEEAVVTKNKELPPSELELELKAIKEEMLLLKNTMQKKEKLYGQHITNLEAERDGYKKEIRKIDSKLHDSQNKIKFMLDELEELKADNQAKDKLIAELEQDDEESDITVTAKVNPPKNKVFDQIMEYY